MAGMMILNSCFLLELIIDLIVFGVVNAYKQHFRTWIETICSVINLCMMIMYLTHMRDGVMYDYSMYNVMVGYFYLIILIRALKILSFM